MGENYRKPVFDFQKYCDFGSKTLKMEKKYDVALEILVVLRNF